MSKEIEPLHEGLFGAAKQFSDAFFDGLKNNAVDKVLAKARAVRVDREVIEKMEYIQRQKHELDKIIAKMPKTLPANAK